MVLHISRQSLQDIERLYRNEHPSKFIARLKITQQLKIGMGTLENILRGRVKSIDAELYEKINALKIRTIEAEILRLQHDLHLTRQMGRRLDSAQMAEIETCLASIQQLLKGDG